MRRYPRSLVDSENFQVQICVTGDVYPHVAQALFNEGNAFMMLVCRADNADVLVL